MTHRQHKHGLRFVLLALLIVGNLGWVRAADTLTTPPDSLNGLRPGKLTLGQLEDKYGKSEIEADEGLLGLYGGAKDSHAYGWYLVENPNYVVPDLAVETATDSDRVDLVMSIGYDGLKTEKGVACFQSDADLIKAYGEPDFVFSVQMGDGELREFYYIAQGVSFDVAPIGPNGERLITTIYVTYPEYLKRAVDIRRDLINNGTGREITSVYASGVEA